MGNGRILVIMDNASYHKTPKLLEFYEKNKINVLYNIPYHPEINMIESTFAFLKSDFYYKEFSLG